MILYGDLYLQLFRKSEYGDDEDIFKNKENKTQQLHEDINVYKFAKNDHYVHYLEAIDNPAKMFELTRFGKTSGFIKTDNIPTAINTNAQNLNGLNGFTSMYQYNASSSDINIYTKDKFVHAAFETGINRTVEEVTLFKNDEDKNGIKYRVRKGQSLLYNFFKIWREMSLIENSVLLNRVTKSSIVRLVNVQVGDMPQENVGPYLQRIKSLLEQKSTFDVGQSMTEYTNPGPVENNIYIPVYGEKGGITIDQSGGDVNVSQLPDLEYFQNKFFGSARIPKQYFGLTDDAAGFSGGESLAIISSRYAKAVKKIQNTLIQAITSAINLMLIDKGLVSYANNFMICMQAPTTKEEIDRRDNEVSKIQMVQEVMNLVSDIDNPSAKLKILKSMLANTITDTDVIALIEEEISKLDKENVEDDISETEDDIDLSDLGTSNKPSSLADSIGIEPSEEPQEEISGEEISTTEEPLPTPEETGLDLTDNTNEI